jgi:predicted acyltransferase
MFISGVAVPFSLGRSLENGIKRKTLLLKVAKRASILVIFGVIYNNGISFDFANMSYASVLGQIGIAYFIAVSIYLYSKKRTQIIWILGILFGFWAAMTLIPVPNIGAAVLTPEGNFSGYIDRLFLPGITYRPNYDPQGILLMISAAAITLSGIITGKFIKNEKFSGIKKTIWMFVVGLLLVGLSLIWNIVYPINKEIWSSSFNVLTIGLSIAILSIFYFIVDVKGLKKWTFPFVLIGLNSITIYMANRIIDFSYTSEFFMSGIMNLVGDFSRVFLLIGVVLLELLLLYFLYKRKIFLKV